MRALLIMALVVSCGEDQGGSPSADQNTLLPMNKASSPLPSGTSTSTSTSNEGIKPDRQVETPESAREIFWLPSLELAQQVTNQNSVPLQVGFVMGIKYVQVNESTCLTQYWTNLPYQSQIDVPIASRNTLVTLNVRLQGQDDTISSCKSFTFHHDSNAPTSPSIKINNQGVVTRSLDVKVQLSSTDADEVYITNKMGCSYGGSWTSLTAEKSWTLAYSNATNTVYAKYRDKAGNESDCVSASIVHDDTAPTLGKIKINDDAAEAYSASVVLSLFAIDAKEMAIFDSYSSCSLVSSGYWQTYATNKSWTLLSTTTTASTANVYVRFRDAAGNTTDCISDSISLPSVKLTYTWFEGSYYPAYPACGFNYARDYSTVKTKTVSYPPFTTLSGSGRTCDFSRSGSNYYCDWTDNLYNCSRVTEYLCNGKSTYPYTYPGALSCVRPSGVPY